jgi:NADH dehydrogenase
MKQVVIVGGGFAGLNAAKLFGNAKDVEVTLIDRSNHHLFQPLLYQVAMAGLSPAEIAVPIRSLLARYRNIRVLQAEAESVDLDRSKLTTNVGGLDYDYLILANGAQHTYFGHEEWEKYAPGLKTLPQAVEIRRRILTAYEKAESETDPEKQKQLLTFVVVGGGATGVELAGSIGEMSRYALAKDFRHIDPKLTRVILIEAMPRILPSFSQEQASRATRALEGLGVQVWTSSRVTKIDAKGAEIGPERIQAATVLWAAGIRASGLGQTLGVSLDRIGRIIVEPDLSLADHPNVFAVGDLAHFAHQTGESLPALAPVALQQGRFVAKNILQEIDGRPRQTFTYLDKGQMATIGRSRAIVEMGKIRFWGFFAWIAWLLVHIYYLTGFKNRLFVVLQWAFSYLTFHRGARLIVEPEWRQYPFAQCEPSARGDD